MDASKLRTFRDECMKAHNEYRKAHGAESLQESKELNDFAQSWAETMAASGQFKHSNNRDYGENIAFMMRNPGPTGYDITTMWYDEVNDYSWETQKSKVPGRAIGHFTQVVWKSTTHAGFGIAQTSNNKYYAVGSYNPAGNMQMPGYYERNVGRKTGTPNLPEPEKPPKHGGSASKPIAPTDGGSMPKPGEKVETKVEFYNEGGKRYKKTTTITTTVTEQPGGGMKTLTSTATRTEEVDPSATEDSVTDKLEKLNVTKDSDDDVEEQDDANEGNTLPRLTMKDFRKSFLEQANAFRTSKGASSLSKDNALQKLAQKCANARAKGKDRSDQVGAALKMAVAPFPESGGEAAKNLEIRSKSDDSSKQLFEILMSQDRSRMGVGVSCTEGGDPDFTHIIIYME